MNASPWMINIIFLIFLIVPVDLYALTVGSNSATAIEAITSFPQTDTNNTMLGFGRFSNGFGLASASTTCTFNDFFPVGGPIYMNGGTLYLKEDLVCSASTYIYTGGTINAQGHAVVFDNKNNSTMPIMQGNGSEVYVTSLTPRVQTIQSISWSYDDKYIGIIMPPLVGWAYSFNGNQLTLSNFHSYAPGNGLTSGQWNPSRDLFAIGWVAGSIYAVYVVDPLWNGIASFNDTTTIHSVAWNTTGTYFLVSRQATPCLQIYSYNLTTSAFASKATATGHPVYDPIYGIYNTVSWSSSSSFFAATSTDTSHALTIYSFTGTYISEIVSATTDHLPSAVSWSPTSSYIAVTFYDSTPTASWLRIYQFTPPSTLTQVLSYPGTSTGSATALSWSPDGTKLAVSVASGAGNTFNTFAFNPSLPAITPLWSSGSLVQPVTTSNWSHSGYYLASANTNGLVTVYVFNSPHGMVFNNANLKFSGDVYLNTPPIIFQGTCILDGNNCGLYLGSAGITVASGSSLLLKDLTIYNITGTNISCADNTSTISFSNVTWCQDGDVTFAQGRLAITGELAMTGGHQFIYQSDQTSTIYDHATWYFDYGMTFSYCPPLGETNLINFQNNSSTLYLYGTNLYAASTGLRLTKGCLTIEGPCPFISDSVDETHGIWIGDATAADDLKVKILAESGIEVEKGYASYRNTK